MRETAREREIEYSGESKRARKRVLESERESERERACTSERERTNKREREWMCVQVCAGVCIFEYVCARVVSLCCSVLQCGVACCSVLQRLSLFAHV